MSGITTPTHGPLFSSEVEQVRRQDREEIAELRAIAAEALALGGHGSECASHREVCVECGHSHHYPLAPLCGTPTKFEPSGVVVVAHCRCTSLNTKPPLCTCGYSQLIERAKAAGVEVE